MGAMALIRQLNYDSNWYDLDNSETKDFSLEAIIENKKLPKFFYLLRNTRFYTINRRLPTDKFPFSLGF